MPMVEVTLVGDTGSGKADIVSSLSAQLLVMRRRHQNLILSRATTVGDIERSCVMLFDPYRTSQVPTLSGSGWDLEVTVLVVAVDKPESAKALSVKWASYLAKSPKLLVFSKVHLRSDPYTIRRLADRKESPLSQAEGLELAGRLGVDHYCEVSTFSGFGVDGLLSLVFEAAIQANRARGTSCNLI